jgi:hypothetical protein
MDRSSNSWGRVERGSTVVGGLLIAGAVVGLVGLGAAGARADSSSESQPAAGVRTPVTVRLAAASAVTQDQSVGFAEGVKEMMEEHMGLTGAEAEEWASDMADHMRDVHGDAADEMLDACGRYWNDETSTDDAAGPQGSTDSGEATGPGYGDPSGYGMMGGSGGYGGMMGGFGGMTSY